MVTLNIRSDRKVCLLGVQNDPIFIQYSTVCLLRKDPHGFFAFPVTDAIAPGYSMIIKHPMDFSTMKDKIGMNEYKTVTEFKVSGVLF